MCATFNGNRMDTYDRSNINELELWQVLEGLRCWYPEFKGKSVTIFTDNTQVMICLERVPAPTPLPWSG